jgi:hypothetical protein
VENPAELPVDKAREVFGGLLARYPGLSRAGFGGPDSSPGLRGGSIPEGFRTDRPHTLEALERNLPDVAERVLERYRTKAHPAPSPHTPAAKK